MKIYVNSNSFFGWAVVQTLPYARFIYLTLPLDEGLATASDSKIGYFVDVDMEYTVTIKKTIFSIIS